MLVNSQINSISKVSFETSSKPNHVRFETKPFINSCSRNCAVIYCVFLVKTVLRSNAFNEITGTNKRAPAFCLTAHKQDTQALQKYTQKKPVHIVTNH